MKRNLLLLCTLIFTKNLNAEILTFDTYWEGLKDGVSLMGKGSVDQFKEKNNLYIAVAAVPSLWWSFENDDRINENQKSKEISKFMQISSDLSPALSFPLIPYAFFTYGKVYDDVHSVQFAKEYFAALYLALVESAAISLIPVHERPNTENLSKLETAFRGDSSFPSGHVVPYATLAFKTFQFYGPLPALAPLALFVGTSYQRVRDQKHFFSDIVGGFFLSAFASEGVRRAGLYKNNHPIYREIFEHDVQVGVSSYRGVIGPRLSWNW